MKRRACIRPTLILAVALISSCGFHRQGVATVSPLMKVTYLDAEDTRTDFQIGLRRALEAGGAQLTARREDATATLRITRDETGRRVLSVSARNTPTEYEVYYTVTYSVSAGSQQLLEPQTLLLTRDYSFNEQAVLAKDSEEDILRQALARDLVSIVVRRLASL